MLNERLESIKQRLRVIIRPFLDTPIDGPSADINSVLLVGSKQSFFYSAIFCILLCYLLYPVADTRELFVWACCHCLIILTRILVTPTKLSLNDPERLKKIFRIATFGVLITAASWGFAAIHFIDGTSSNDAFLVILFLSTVGVIGTINYWALNKVGLSFLILTIGPVYIKLLLVGTTESHLQILWLTIYLTILFLVISRSVKKAKTINEKENENIRIKSALARNWHLLEENKKALKKEAELRLENEFYKDLIDKAKGLLVMVNDLDQEGKILYVSTATAKHFGLRKEEIIGKYPIDFDKSLEGDYERILASLRAGKSVNFESKHPIQGSEEIPVEISIFPYQYNDKNLAIAFMQNITIRKELEQKHNEFEAALAERRASEQFKSMVETLPDHAIRVDNEMRLQYANTKVAESIDLVFEINSEDDTIDLDDTPLSEIQLPKTEFGVRYFRSIGESISTKSSTSFSEWIRRKDKRICLDVRINPELNKDGVCVGALALTRDITEKALLNEALTFISKELRKQKPKQRLQSIPEYLCKALLFDSAIVETLNADDELKVVSAFGSAKKFIGESRSLSGSICESIKNNAYIMEFESIKFEFASDTYIQSLPYENALCAPLGGQKGIPSGYLTLFSARNFSTIGSARTLVQFFSGRLTADVEAINLESIKRIHKQEFQSLVEQSPDYISRFDARGICTYANPALKALFSDITFEGVHVSRQTPTSDGPGPDLLGIFAEVLSSGIGKNVQYFLTAKNNKTVYLDSRIVPEFDDSGEIFGVMTISRDITARIHLEEDLRRQATIDQLTNLPNRRLFTESLADELNSAKKNAHSVALLFIDLDRFKEINDTLGHEIGDDLLIETSARLIECTSEFEKVYRLGGDEFVVLVSKSELNEVKRLALSLIKSLSQPYILEGNESHVSASIGIAQFPQDALTSASLMSCADQAMYAAKQQGRNGYCLFTASMRDKAEARANLISDLRCAIDLNQLEVFYQPIVDTLSQAPVKAEALLRWHHPRLGAVPPSEFIPIAEETGLIVNIGDWVFAQVVDAVKFLCETHGLSNIQVAINVSPRHFIHTGAVDHWISLIRDARISPSCIAIEITENLLIDDVIDTQKELNKLREFGIQLALDDFGTGYSAMAYLKRFNIDYLKIDGSFIRDLEEDPSDRAITETIVWMAHRLGMKSVAECVETEAQKQMLEEFGCDYLQGYYYSKPLALNELIDYVRAESANKDCELRTH